jgi:hypothetical protein
MATFKSSTLGKAMVGFRRRLIEWLSHMRELQRPRDPLARRPRPPWALAKFPAAQAANEELVHAPLVRSTIDRKAIEEELQRHLVALEQTVRPVRWFDSLIAAHTYVSQHALAAIESWATDFFDGPPEGDSARPPMRDDDDDHARNRAILAVRSRSWNEALESAWCAADREAVGVNPDKLSWNHSDSAGYRAPMADMETDAREAALKASLDAVEEQGRNPAWSAARNGAWRLAMDTALDAVGVARKLARWSVILEHGASNPEAVSLLGDAGRRAFAALRRAYNAGLWAFWVRDEEIVAVPAPNLHTDDRARLHRIGGPAVEWSGETYWFIKGRRVAAGETTPPAEALKEERRERIGRVVDIIVWGGFAIALLLALYFRL